MAAQCYSELVLNELSRPETHCLWRGCTPGLLLGDVFEGDYIRGQIQGDGKLTKLDDSVYTGPWKDGKMHGQGTFTFASGAK